MPNLLVLSHEPFSDSSDGKTLYALVSGWDKDHLAQLYLSGDPPNFAICEKYFSISFRQILGCFLEGSPTGLEVTRDNAGKENKRILRTNLFKDQRRAIIRFIVGDWNTVRNDWFHNFFWRKRWYSKNLECWLDNYKPDVLLFQNSRLFFIFDIAEYICKRYDIPFVMESTDDYFTGKKTLNPFFWIGLRALQKRYQKFVNSAHCVYAIGDKMQEEYQRRFGGRFKVAMNSVDIAPLESCNLKGKKKILYAGNLHSGRWRILEKIGKALRLLKSRDEIDAELIICSLSDISKNIVDRLTIPGHMSFIGALNSEQLCQQRKKSTLLLHVENFSSKDKFFTRLSVSTKIPEYMMSGRCILAVGPSDVASIEYIRDNKMGAVVSSTKIEDICNALKDIFSDDGKRQEYIENAYKMACVKHNKDKVAADVKDELLAAITIHKRHKLTDDKNI